MNGMRFHCKAQGGIAGLASQIETIKNSETQIETVIWEVLSLGFRQDGRRAARQATTEVEGMGMMETGTGMEDVGDVMVAAEDAEIELKLLFLHIDSFANHQKQADIFGPI